MELLKYVMLVKKDLIVLIERLDKENPIAAAKFENQVENILEIFDNLKDDLE
jgi:hypothetical protein